MAFKPQPKGFATKAIHVGQNPEQLSPKSIVSPLSTSTVYKIMYPDAPEQYSYGRSDNPTRFALEKCLASLDNAKYALTFACGGAVTTTISQLLSAGDHIVLCDDIYSGTRRFFSKIATCQNIENDFVDATNLDNLKNAIKKNTRIIWIESPTNPGMKVLDIEAISNLAHSYENIIVVVDNAFLTPYFQRPLELGADIAVNSLGKFTNGHSDVMMGAAAVNDDKLYERLRFLQNASGAIPSPFDCYQVIRSLKTLKLRMEQHCKSSLIVAQFLKSHPNVECVLHPGLPSHPQHELALKQSYGHSGLIAVYLKGGLNESKKFFQSLKIFALTESFGGCESLVNLPSLMSHSPVPKEDRAALGITDSLIRLSVGLEDVEDLIEDLKQALAAAFA